MKKIFASDLDQTLIYSKKFLEGLSEEEKKYVVMVEDKSEDIRSFMSSRTAEKIIKFMENNLFIPTTTRTIEQFRRVFIFQNELYSKYAIVSNGGNIIVDGIVDREWNETILKKIKNECISKEEIIKKFSEIHDNSWSSEYKEADNLFYYFIVNPEIYPTEKMKSFEKWLNENGWMLSLQKRKLYMVPKVVDKQHAVKHIAEKEGVNYICSAGDSKLDFKMLKNSNVAVVPKHSMDIEELKKNQRKEFLFTQKNGIFSSEEILEYIQ
jgi:hydroxymethylpyrimidine pyrophosphatase-like HAD family hydrolase